MNVNFKMAYFEFTAKIATSSNFRYMIFSKMQKIAKI